MPNNSIDENKIDPIGGNTPPPAPDMSAWIQQAIQDMPVAQKYTTEIYGHNLMQAQASDSKSATEFMRVAESTRRDAIVVSPPGCVMLQGRSQAMHETMSKFGAQRQDVNLDNGKAVACYWPGPGQTAQSLAQGMTEHYQSRALVEQCRWMGVQRLTHTNGMAIAQGTMEPSEAQEVARALSSEHGNAVAIYRNNGNIEATVKMDDAMMAQLDAKGYGALSSTEVSPDTATFRFGSIEEANKFLQDVQQIAQQNRPVVQVVPQQGITIVKAHELSQSKATDMVGVIGEQSRNPVVLHSVDGTPDKMQVMVDGRSPLGQAMMEKYADNLVGSTNPSVATFQFDSRVETMGFLNEANRLGMQIERNEQETGDVGDGDVGDDFGEQIE